MDKGFLYPSIEIYGSVRVSIIFPPTAIVVDEEAIEPNDPAVVTAIPASTAPAVTAVPTAAELAAMPDATAEPTIGTAEIAVSVPLAMALKPEAMTGNRNNIISSLIKFCYSLFHFKN